MKKKNFATVGLILIAVLVLSSCGSASGHSTGANEPINLNIAYQYGLAYAPPVICQNKKLIEQAYKKKTGKDVNVTWNQMSSGADINTGIASGDLDVGFMGVAPAVTGVSNNVGYKIFTGVAGQEHGLMTNLQDVNNIGDLINTSNQIAIVNIGSFQHIILGMALDAAGYDAHALDSNLVAMKHPDAMAALESNAVSCHVTSSPYIFKERANSGLKELEEVNNIYSAERTHIVGVASETLYNDNPELYKALCDAIEEAIKYIQSDVESTAKITSEYDGNSLEDEITYLQACNYSSETVGIYDLASFMYKNGFTDKEIKEYKDLVFDNVKGN